MTRNIFPIILFFLPLFFNKEVAGQQKSVSENPEQVLRIMSYNIHHANPPSKPDSIDIDAIVRVINDAKAHIVALQEVDKNTARSGNLDEAKMIAEKTGLHYHFFKAIDHDGGDYGLAILSRYPLKNVKLVSLPQKTVTEKRILAYVTIKAGGRKLIFANTHLDAKNNENRVLQMRHILATFENTTAPVILCGDLNSVAGTEVIDLLDKQFKRTCGSDCPATVPQVNPRRTIDFIATKSIGWSLLSHDVIAETYASDHRPVIVTFQIK